LPGWATRPSAHLAATRRKHVSQACGKTSLPVAAAAGECSRRASNLADNESVLRCGSISNSQTCANSSPVPTKKNPAAVTSVISQTSKVTSVMRRFGQRSLRLQTLCPKLCIEERTRALSSCFRCAKWTRAAAQGRSRRCCRRWFLGSNARDPGKYAREAAVRFRRQQDASLNSTARCDLELGLHHLVKQPEVIVLALGKPAVNLHRRKQLVAANT
jgi:hypothetical protein